MPNALRTLWLKPQSLSVPDRRVRDKVSMVLCVLRNRKIQENDVVNSGASLVLAHVPPREHSNRKRTSYLFHMVAELAIELARICVTRA
eukprot:78920-Amphidinium_carterae.1